jgi:hypothetical protein
MRIPRLRLQLGALLLFEMSLHPTSFILNGPVRSPFVARQVPVASQQSGRFVSLPRLETRDSTQVVEEERRRILKEIDNINETPSIAMDRLPWVGMLVVLMYTQFLAGKPSFPIDLSSQKEVAYSVVSATLLRSTSTKSVFSGQQLIMMAFLAWQLFSQTGNVIRLFQTVGTSFSVWYLTCLSTIPLYTKAVTTAVIGLMGDTSAQALEESIHSRKEGSRFDIQNYDRRRGLSNVANGLFVTGPLLHFAYEWLEKLIPIAGATGSASVAALTQVLIDNVFLDAGFVAIMFVTTGIGEGYAKQIIPQFKKDYFAAVKTSWATSITLLPLGFACFRFLPLSLRVLGINIIDIFWEAMVSYRVHQRRRGAIKDDEPVPIIQLAWE